MATYKHAYMRIKKRIDSSLMFQSLISRGHMGCVAVLHCMWATPTCARGCLKDSHLQETSTWNTGMANKCLKSTAQTTGVSAASIISEVAITDMYYAFMASNAHFRWTSSVKCHVTTLFFSFGHRIISVWWQKLYAFRVVLTTTILSHTPRWYLRMHNFSCFVVIYLCTNFHAYCLNRHCTI